MSHPRPEGIGPGPDSEGGFVPEPVGPVGPAGRLVLRPLNPADEPAAMAAQAELATDGFTFLLDLPPDVGVPGDSRGAWARYLQTLERQRQGLELVEDRVPATFLVAVVDGRLVGRVSVRHRLNDYLRDWGGHLGYGVRPTCRRRGYATEILRRSLLEAAAVGLERALVICEDGNLGSATVIERCGGVLQDVAVDPDGVAHRRYWITVR